MCVYCAHCHVKNYIDGRIMQEKPRYQSDEGANGAKESNLDDAADDTFQDTVSPLETTPGLY
jgi:hypothetical protein